jgi:hypothetical protein
VSTTAATAAPVSAPRDLKKAARQVRHAKFVSRIEKKAATASSSKTSRRRPSKKLVSTLDSLADALPELTTRPAELEDAFGRNSNKKGLKSRPGAMKRKEQLLKSECERFGKNLAILETGEKGTEGSMSSWAKLRGFIGATLEKKEEFVEMEKAKEGVMDIEA